MSLFLLNWLGAPGAPGLDGKWTIDKNILSSS